MLPITLAEFSISPCVFVKTERRNNVLVCSFIDNAINLHAFRDEKRTRRRGRRRRRKRRRERKKKGKMRERKKETWQENSF